MQDLSSMFSGSPVDALVPTAQQSPGTLHSSRSAAGAAPGSVPAMAEGNPEQPGPHVAAAEHERRTVTHADRPLIRVGQWNDLGGGPAPGTERTPN